VSALQISGGMFSAGDLSPARDGIISLHPDFLILESSGIQVVRKGNTNSIPIPDQFC